MPLNLFLPVECSPGYEDINDKCEPCKIGYYKPEYAAAKCRECPAGFRTAVEGSIHENNCTVRKSKCAVKLFLIVIYVVFFSLFYKEANN